MCDSDCCSGGGGGAAECSRQSAPVNAEHLERRRVSSRSTRGLASEQTRAPVTPSNPSFLRFSSHQPKLVSVKATLMIFECGIKIRRYCVDWIRFSSKVFQIS